MNFRGLHEDRATRQFRVFTTLDSHVPIPVTAIRSVASPVEFFTNQYETGTAIRSWQLMARAFDPELRRADL